MRMKKRSLTHLLLVVLVAAALTAAFSLSVSAEGTWVTVDGIVGGQICFDSSTGTITDCETSVTSADIPETINGIVVNCIGNSAFSNCRNLTDVFISNSITTIGYSAFYSCRSLVSVSIPDSVITIGNQAFYFCTKLTDLTIGDGLTTIGYQAFARCTKLIDFTITSNVTTIGNRAFYGCTHLSKFIVDANNEYYSTDACGVLFNKGKTTLIQYPFGNTDDSYSIIDSVTSIGNYAFYNCTSLANVDIGDNITSIGSHAFSGCTSLTNVDIPNSVISIGGYAFSDCTSVTSIHIGDSVISIGVGAFYRCTSLSNIDIGNNVTSIGDSAFNSCTGLISVDISDSVISIGSRAFDSCTGLTSVNIGNSVTSIDNYAFYNCTSLTNATVPDSVTSIGNYSFDGCTSLASVDIGDGVTTIGDYAFRSCTSLISVDIPYSVTSIGGNAFESCTSLTGFTVDGNNKYYSNDSRGAVFNKNKTTIEIYPRGNTNTSYSIPNSVTTIGARAFDECTSLTNVDIGEKVTFIDYSAFYNCTNLTNVNIPSSLTSIGNYAFYGCTNLKQVNYSGTKWQWDVISIGNNNGCLTNANISFSISGSQGDKETGDDSSKEKYTFEFLSDADALSFFGFLFDISFDSIDYSGDVDSQACEKLSEYSPDLYVLYQYMTGKLEKDSDAYKEAQICLYMLADASISSKLGSYSTDVNNSKLDLLTYLKSKSGYNDEDGTFDVGEVNSILSSMKESIISILDTVTGTKVSVIIDAYNSISGIKGKVEKYNEDMTAVFNAVKFTKSNNMIKLYNYYRSYLYARKWLEYPNTGETLFSIYMNSYTLNSFSDFDALYIILKPFGVKTWLDTDVQELIAKFAEFMYWTGKEIGYTAAESPKTIENAVDNPKKYTYSGGTGEKGNPYIISTTDDLVLLTSVVNSGVTYTGTYFSQSNDIDISAVYWLPIGDATTNFGGNYDGNLYEITGLYCWDEDSIAGLFGYCSTDSTISDLNVTGATVVGKDYVGVISSYSRGKLTNCNVFSSVVYGETNVGGICGFGESILSCLFSNSVLLGTESVGGISGELSGYVYGLNGWNGSYITKCSVEYCEIKGKHHIGGICGYVGKGQSSAWACGKSIIKSCCLSCKISGISSIGGILGVVYHFYTADNLFVSECYNTSSVTSQSYSGGIIGAADMGFMSNGNTKICNCYNTGNITSTYGSTGGICGGLSKEATNCYDLISENHSRSLFGNGSSYTSTSCYSLYFPNTMSSDQFSGWNFSSVWAINDDGYPVLRAFETEDITITFYWQENVVDSKKVKLGHLVPYQSYEEYGFRIVGWYTNKNCSGEPWDFSKDRVTSEYSDGLELWAKFERNSLFYQPDDVLSFINHGKYFCNENYSDNLTDEEKSQYIHEISDADYEKLEKNYGILNISGKSKLKKKRDETWNGSCFGMSAVALLTYSGMIDITNYGSNSIDSLIMAMNHHGCADVGKVESLINHYHLMQYLPNIDKLRTYDAYNESNNLKALVSKLESGEPVLFDLKLKLEYGKSMHTCVAYGMTSNDDNTVYNIKVYDCSCSYSEPLELVIYRNGNVYTKECTRWEKIWKTESIFIMGSLTADDFSGVTFRLMDEEDPQYELTTNFDSFTISDGTSAVTVTDGEVVGEDSIGITHYGNQNEPGYDPSYKTILPALENGSYVITPTEELESYEITLYCDSDDGFFHAIDTDKPVAVTINADGSLSTQTDSKTEQTITSAFNGSDIGADSVTITGSSTGFSTGLEGSSGEVQVSSNETAEISLSLSSGLKDKDAGSTIQLSEGENLTLEDVEGDDTGCKITSGEETVETMSLGYVVVFDSCGGSTVQSCYVDCNTAATEPEEPTYDGYNFLGWYTDENLTTQWSFDDPVTEDLLLYAGWERDPEYWKTVTFSAEGYSDQIIIVAAGTLLTEDDIPDIITDDNKYIQWNEEILKNPITKDITVTGIVMDVPAGILSAAYTATLTLNDSIDIKLHINGLGDDVDKSEIAVIVDGVIINDYDITDDGVCCLLASVQPVNMADSYHIEVTYGGSATVKTFDYSIRKYCEAVFKHTSYGEDSLLGQLCKAVLNYGAWADNYFNGKTDSTVNSGCVMDFDGVTIPVPPATGFTSGTAVTAADAALSLNSRITVKFTLFTDMTLTKDSITIMNDLAQPERVHPDNISVTPVDGGYEISIVNIGASKLSRAYTLTISGVDENEFSITYGVYSYCYGVCNHVTDDDFTDTLKTLCKAIYSYGCAAKNYADSLED